MMTDRLEHQLPIKTPGRHHAVAMRVRPMLDYVLAYVAVGVAILLMFLFWVPTA